MLVSSPLVHREIRSTADLGVQVCIRDGKGIFHCSVREALTERSDGNDALFTFESREAAGFSYSDVSHLGGSSQAIDAERRMKRKMETSGERQSTHVLRILAHFSQTWSAAVMEMPAVVTARYPS